MSVTPMIADVGAVIDGHSTPFASTAERDQLRGMAGGLATGASLGATAGAADGGGGSWLGGIPAADAIRLNISASLTSASDAGAPAIRISTSCACSAESSDFRRCSTIESRSFNAIRESAGVYSPGLIAAIGGGHGSPAARRLLACVRRCQPLNCAKEPKSNAASRSSANQNLMTLAKFFICHPEAEMTYEQYGDSRRALRRDSMPECHTSWPGRAVASGSCVPSLGAHPTHCMKSHDQFRPSA